MEVRLRVLANGAHFGSLFANVDMAAVGADPNLNIFGNENGFGVELFEKCAVSFLVFLFDLAYCFEEVSDSVKAFFLSGLCKACIHIGPFVVFAFSRVEKVGCGIGHLVAVKDFKPKQVGS